MKSAFLSLILFTLFCSCNQESDSPQEVEVISNYQGVFLPTSGINGTGTVKIYMENNQYKLALSNYSISSGPDLKVYMSKSNTPTDFVNLGNLDKSKVYTIPNNIDLKDYKFVLIHCQNYNHLFAVAELIKK